MTARPARIDAWPIEPAAAPRGSRFVMTDGNDDASWTGDRTRARRFTTESAAVRFIARNLEGGAARRHQWS